MVRAGELGGGGKPTTYQTLLHSYVQQTTTHGIKKITSIHHRGRKAFWVAVFLSSFSACVYHCSYLIANFLSNPKVTITQEKDADYVEFPALTVCNLNVIKKDFVKKYFEMASRRNAFKKNGKPISRPLVKEENSTFCYQSEAELFKRSAVDLSDTWLYLGVTKENLSFFGHKYENLVIQCTYNSKDCSDNTTSFQVVKTNVTSPTFGLCHTISVKNRENEPVMIKKGGTTQGIRLTLNIERSEYWDLISSEYGVRLLVHPQGTFPTLQRGGIIASPGRSVHIGVKRKVTKLLPGREGSCTETFMDSKIVPRMKILNLDFDLEHVKYTYEHCNTVCQNTILFENCTCLDEQPRISSGKTKWKFCNPCNKTAADCRSNVLKKFTDAGDVCDEICKPSCDSVRYDISLSKADWPNLLHQQFVMNRSFDKWGSIPEAMGLLQDFNYDGDYNTTDFVNDTFFRENLLRVHVFIEEMMYMSIEERYSYTLPKLLADLGGCLGLYLGVSVISIIEFVDLCGSWSLLCLLGGGSDAVRRTGSTSRKRRRNRRFGGDENGSSAYTSSVFKPTLGYFRKKGHAKNNNVENEDEVWRNSVFSPRNPPYYAEDIPRKQVIRRF